MNNTATVLSAEGLTKTYRSGPQSVTVWQDVDFEIHSGESVAIVGASGSGKTSLLNVLGGLDSQDAGRVVINGLDIQTLSGEQRTKLRNRDIGFVYQFHHLLPEFTAAENVMMPLLLAGTPEKQAYQRAMACLDALKMTGRESHKPSELSGGERQRTAIARALVNEPRLVLMDEPTGNLDQETAAEVEHLIDDLRSSLATAFVLVTHDQALASRMDRVYRLVDRKLQPSD